MDREHEMKIGECLSSLYSYNRYFVMQDNMCNEKYGNISRAVNSVIGYMEDAIADRIRPVGYLNDDYGNKTSYVYVCGDSYFESCKCRHATSVSLGYYDSFVPQGYNLLAPSLSMSEILSFVSNDRIFDVIPRDLLQEISRYEILSSEINIERKNSIEISDKDTPENYIRKVYDEDSKTMLHTESKDDITYVEVITHNSYGTEGITKRGTSFVLKDYDITEINDFVTTKYSVPYDTKLHSTQTPTDIFIAARHNPDCAKLILSLMREKCRREDESRLVSKDKGIFCSLEENIQKALKQMAERKQTKRKTIKITLSR